MFVVSKKVLNKLVRLIISGHKAGWKEPSSPLWLWRVQHKVNCCLAILISYSIKPYFSVSRVVWMQHYNGVFAVANIRGGDEYGEDWHKGGIKENKQNGFDDFKAAARCLIEKNYTSPQRYCPPFSLINFLGLQLWGAAMEAFLLLLA